jgi:hypothetical protein
MSSLVARCVTGSLVSLYIPLVDPTIVSRSMNSARLPFSRSRSPRNRSVCVSCRYLGDRRLSRCPDRTALQRGYAPQRRSPRPLPQSANDRLVSRPAEARRGDPVSSVALGNGSTSIVRWKDRSWVRIVHRPHVTASTAQVLGARAPNEIRTRSPRISSSVRAFSLLAGRSRFIDRLTQHSRKVHRRLNVPVWAASHDHAYHPESDKATPRPHRHRSRRRMAVVQPDANRSRAR